MSNVIPLKDVVTPEELLRDLQEDIDADIIQSVVVLSYHRDSSPSFAVSSMKYSDLCFLAQYFQLKLQQMLAEQSTT